MKTKTRKLTVCVTALLCAASIACDDEVIQNGIAVEQESDKLLYWSTGLRPMQPEVCFYKLQGSVSDADFDASADVVRQILAEEWGAASGLDFQGTGRCASPTAHPDGSGHDFFPEDIRIAMVTGNPPDPADIQTETSPIPGDGCFYIDGDGIPRPHTYGGGNWGSGPDALEAMRSCAYSMVIPLDVSSPVFARRNTCHEFGHSLGFAHEHGHRDNPQTVCPSGTWSDIPGTPYDVMSVMHYNHVVGSADWVNCPAPGNWGWDLSSRSYTYADGLSFYDRLGAELAYPHSFEPLVCGDRSVIENGQVRFKADVVRRGAVVNNTSESMLQNVVWSVDGQDMQALCATAGCTADAVELSFPANLIAAGNHTVTLAYDDFWGRHHESVTPFTTSNAAIPFESFESSPTVWTATNGTLTVSTIRATHGASSLQVNASGYVSIASPLMNSSDIAQVGDKVLLDVFIPSGQPNPYWLGAVQLFVTIPGRNIYSVYLGQVELTGLGVNAWNTLSFNVPSDVRAALESSGLAVRFAVAANTPWGAPALALDNIRFAQNLSQKSGALDPCPTLNPTPIPQNTLFSFDVPFDWDAANTTEIVGTIANRIALEVEAAGYTPVLSRSFVTADEISTVTNRLAVDIMLPKDPVNPHWQGDLSLKVTCLGVGLNNQYVGNVGLSNLPADMFQTVEFTLPSNVTDAFAGNNTCTIELDLNVGENAGKYYFDNMRLVPTIPVV